MDPIVIAVLCVVAAMVLAIADLFIPSGGMLAVASLLMAMIGVYFGFRSSSTAGLVTLSLILLGIPIFITVALHAWPYTPIGKRVILRTPGEDVKTQTTPDDPLLELIGQIGIAQNSLMPSGHVRLNHRNYNAVADGPIIEAGQAVEIIAVKQRNLIVVASRNRPTSDDVANDSPGNETGPKSGKLPKLGESLLDRPAEDLGLDSLDS